MQIPVSRCVLELGPRLGWAARSILWVAALCTFTFMRTEALSQVAPSVFIDGGWVGISVPEPTTINYLEFFSHDGHLVPFDRPPAPFTSLENNTPDRITLSNSFTDILVIDSLLLGDGYEGVDIDMMIPPIHTASRLEMTSLW